MQFRQVDVYTKSEAIQVLVMRLSELGLNGFIIHDPADFEEFLENKEYNWDYVDDSLMGLKTVEPHITCYVQDNEQGTDMLSALGGTLDELKENDTDDFYGSLDVTIDCVREEDWANNWKQYYKPMEIGDRLLVVPEWEEAHGGEWVKLVLNPGLTFGTGSHATTRLCLQALDTHIHGGESVLDLGCGSGILSIAALRLGAARAFACDIDEKCVDVAYENAALNGIGKDRYTVRWGDVLSDEALRQEMGGGYDVVVANIVADVIMGLSGSVRPFLKAGGLFLCSGIIDDRAEEVLAKLKGDGWDVFEQRSSEGWFSYLCQ